MKRKTLKVMSALSVMSLLFSSPVLAQPANKGNNPNKKQVDHQDERIQDKKIKLLTRHLNKIEEEIDELIIKTQDFFTDQEEEVEDADDPSEDSEENDEEDADDEKESSEDDDAEDDNEASENDDAEDEKESSEDNDAEGDDEAEDDNEASEDDDAEDDNEASEDDAEGERKSDEEDADTKQEDSDLEDEESDEYEDEIEEELKTLDGKANSFEGKLNAQNHKLDALKNRIHASTNRTGMNAETQTLLTRIEDLKASVDHATKELRTNKEKVKEKKEELESDQGKEEIEKEDAVESTKTWKIQFNQEMDPSTVQGLDVFVLDQDDRVIDLETVYDQSANTFNLNPSSPYNSGETYTLYIGQDIKNKNGLNLRNSVKMTFTVK